MSNKCILSYHNMSYNIIWYDITQYGMGEARIVQLNVYGEFTAVAPSTRELMHTEEYRKFSYTATYTTLHIYMKYQSRGTHPCVQLYGCPRSALLYVCLFIWLSKKCWRNMYAKVCLFRVCGSAYIKTCIYCAHLCRCTDVHVSRHVLLLIRACHHVHICCSILSTHALLFPCG